MKRYAILAGIVLLGSLVGVAARGYVDSRKVTAASPTETVPAA